MKHSHSLTVFFSCTAIVLLLVLAGYLTIENTDSEHPLAKKASKLFPDDSFYRQADAKKETIQAEPLSVSDISITPSPTQELVFVGDSRTVGMKDAVSDDCTYIGKEGEGYYWFSSEGIETLRKVLTFHPESCVIYNLGVNDPENITLYIALYRTICQEFADTDFYYLSVNPLSDDTDFNITNDQICSFNASLKNAFQDSYLDCYDYLIEHGFDTVDGLHYTEATYQAIHDFAVSQLSLVR